MNLFRIQLAALWLVLGLILACQKQPTPKRLEGTIGSNGMVVSTHPIASDIGLSILKKGGNAADAAVATFFALAVVFPEAGNIGGGGFAVYRTKNGEIGALDFREKAPAAAHRDMYLDANGEPIQHLSTRGHLAAGVPGAVAGMVALHQKLGSLPWKELVQPAIDVARNGHVLTAIAAANLNRMKAEFQAANRYPIHLVRNDRPWQAGDTIYHPELAQSLERIRDYGNDGFYKGKTADLIVAEMQAGKGLITHEDLANYRAVWRQPVISSYKGKYRIISMPPPSSGGVALLQLMQGSENYPLAKWGHNTAKTVHVMTELERRVYADRATHLGDPDFYQVPVKMLLNPQYNRSRNANIRMDKKTPSTEIKEGSVDRIESLETTHFSVADKEGNAIALTTTVNGYYGCKVMVQGAGFFLNNEMDDFSIKPGVPNQFGLIGGEANAIAPHKRMLSSMTPTIVEKDGKLYLVVGTPGGSTIITGVYQVILNVIEHGMTMQEAVNAKRFHHQWLPDHILFEKGAFSDDTKKQLEAKGHVLVEVGALCKVDAIRVRPDGKYEGAADYTRSDGKAAGY
ncbi:MAG: gamma-glutamyltransferase [Cytophagales bacterium]|nr:gamma-glutamyltransferase [Bernardetiaceae bacterium]MDW8204253.1 gamma-glutamyltransferase [Cytophagales bacterium]